MIDSFCILIFGKFKYINWNNLDWNINNQSIIICSEPKAFEYFSKARKQLRCPKLWREFNIFVYYTFFWWCVGDIFHFWFSEVSEQHDKS